jgi:hypothetical protein
MAMPDAGNGNAIWSHFLWPFLAVEESHGCRAALLKSSLIDGALSCHPALQMLYTVFLKRNTVD